MRTCWQTQRENHVEGAEYPQADSQRNLNSIMSIKVIAFVDDNGDPDVVPAFGVHSEHRASLRFKISRYNNRIRSLAAGSRVAINVLTLDLITYQLKDARAL